MDDEDHVLELAREKPAVLAYRVIMAEAERDQLRRELDAAKEDIERLRRGCNLALQYPKCSEYERAMGRAPHYDDVISALTQPYASSPSPSRPES